MSGNSTKQSIAGTTAAKSQPPQLISICSMSLASVAHSGLAAMPVMNIEPVIGVKWKHVRFRNSPIFFWEGPGSLPNTVLIDLATGRMMPPERAVTLGMAGAISRSAMPRE